MPEKQSVYSNLSNLKDFKEQILLITITRQKLAFIIRKLWTYSSTLHAESDRYPKWQMAAPEQNAPSWGLTTTSAARTAYQERGSSVTFTSRINTKKKIMWFVIKNFDGTLYSLSKNTDLDVQLFSGPLSTASPTLSFHFLLISFHFIFHSAILTLTPAVILFLFNFSSSIFSPIFHEHSRCYTWTINIIKGSWLQLVQRECAHLKKTRYQNQHRLSWFLD